MITSKVMSISTLPNTSLCAMWTLAYRIFEIVNETHIYIISNV